MTRDRPAPRRARWAVLAAATLCLALGACLPPPPPPPPTFAVYGDSLVEESAAVLRAELERVLPGWNVVIRALGGTAQCDWHASIVDDTDHRNLRAMILAFSGNSITPCSVSRPYPDSYDADARWAADFASAHGLALAFVAAPGPVGTPPDARVVPLVYRAVGAERGVAVVETDDLFVDPATGRYEQTDPCLVDECVDRITIRAPDGAHLCPVLGVVPCSVYSSGVVRYSDGIVRQAAVLAGRTPPPARVLVTTTTSTTSATSPSTSTTTTTSTSTTTTTGPP